MALEYTPKTEDLEEYQKLIGESDDVCKDKESIEVLNDHCFDANSIERRDILDFGDEGFLLGQTLCVKECDHFIEQGEKLGFREISEAKKSYRNCKRILLRSQSLADILWPRILPHLDDVIIEGDPHTIHIHGAEKLLQGTWKPHRLNELFRLCRYEPGGHFAPHFDGHLVMTSDERSLKTFMLYLNGDFDGGSTNFVDESQALYMNDSGRYCAEDKNVLVRIQPEPGMAIIFNHHRLHEGQALRTGKKYILRTDIMYKRVDGPQIDPVETEALSLAQEAERLEAMGDCLKAMELYRKAFKMSPSLAESYGCPS